MRRLLQLMLVLALTTVYACDASRTSAPGEAQLPTLKVMADTTHVVVGWPVTVTATAVDRAGRQVGALGWTMSVSDASAMQLLEYTSHDSIASAMFRLLKVGRVVVQFRAKDGTGGGTTASIAFDVAPVTLRLHLSADTSAAFTGVPMLVAAAVTDAFGNATVPPSWSASVSSDGVGTGIASVDTVPHLSSASLVLRLGNPGAATVVVRAGDATDTLVFQVKPLPPPSTAMVADSFTVIQDGLANYINDYVPLLKLRETSGRAWTEVVALKVTYPLGYTRACRGRVRFLKDQAGHVNAVRLRAIDAPMTLSILDDTLPDGAVEAQAIVRDATGAYGLVTATGVLQRNVVAPHYPPGVDPAAQWNCL